MTGGRYELTQFEHDLRGLLEQDTTAGWVRVKTASGFTMNVSRVEQVHTIVASATQLPIDGRRALTAYRALTKSSTESVFDRATA